MQRHMQKNYCIRKFTTQLLTLDRSLAGKHVQEIYFRSSEIDSDF